MAPSGMDSPQKNYCLNGKIKDYILNSAISQLNNAIFKK